MGIQVHDIFKFSGYGYFFIALLRFIGFIEDPFFMFSVSITALIIVFCDYNAGKIEKRLKLANEAEKPLDNKEIDKLETSYRRTGQYLVFGFVVGLLILPNTLPYLVNRFGSLSDMSHALPNINDGLALTTLGLTFIVMSARQNHEKQNLAIIQKTHSS
ncbi:hypothetical protein COM90_22510 [Bacillus thuringiensis]|uniref:Uncharacterized protein n=1 Tax=Bacillus thuringiensis TaxID=1428 RepID=A0AB36TRP7_BACTU|nr:hypothetical protein [Bacillus thuringiensis]PEE66217.1 hypothetical protein COM74_04340 [Bacillus thuringiensis]PEE86584.1 hypothetical protein COM90_22510 [Bacillus thuringiensis]PFM88082.1 hypothetical protein COJ61_22280 [Bacillus thuringiensis]